ncbi:ATP:cob(I)alamin adenosyltransferase [candidate division WWE3 bacterium CG10_big_fil_rev_8_21_14_0_10_32_10]|uniref:Corrinoid adenosyltransferase n=1 Tax=candidate division WWE3 bacterium CG10_big_fil_rev_8_21_14_0_10_32_10 TaxID=1975090 RepID=A0A2H0RB40_UNCKA|nr:MAG: ATP:cob(I)alamin adenosyltransferase [candidate division WWE3 bacterium CG10_big_fil_rev_8_21_14_0_10_32_10]
MKIYTKTGDKGTTSLLGGKRVKKSNIRVKAYGNIDELNSFVGLLDSRLHTNDKIRIYLRDTQVNLLLVGSHLADEKGKFIKLKDIKKLEKETSKLEREIDKMEKELPKLKNFILPGGCEQASLAHICRTITRRCERLLVSIEEINPHVLKYINRLSDYFFVLARWFNYKEGVTDKIWKI